jgi:hypothetical protein
VATFDFEERALGNFESVPMYWSKLVGRGYPAYATGRFDTTVFRSATTSFRLDIDGGSVAYRFTPPPATFGKGPGRIAVTPDGDYVILAFVKTTPLAHARADLTAWFADASGKPLPDTEVHAIPWAANGTQDAGAWHVMHVFVHGPAATPGGGKSLVLQLGLLQPQQLAEAGLNTGGKKSDGLPAQFQLYQQDIHGTAWFDDITVFQLPRLSISVPASATIAPRGAGGTADTGETGSVNVFPAGGQVALDLAVSDISRNPAPDAPGAGGGGAEAQKQLGVTLTITDPQGLVFARERWNAAPTPEHPWTKAYRHPALPGGIYTATLDILEGGAGHGNAQGLIARRQTRFVALAAQQPPRPPAPEFGLSAAHWPTERWAALEPLARETGVGMVEAPAWRDDLPEGSGGEATRDAGPFDLLVSALARDRIHIIASLESLPPTVSARLHKAAAAATQPDAFPDARDSLLALATADPALWRPSISFLLARHANGVSFWQVMEHPAAGDETPGRASQISAASGREAAFAALYAKARTEIGPLLNDPRLVIPWNALYDFDAKSYPGALLNLRLPATIKPDQLPTYIASFKAASAPPPSGGPAPATLPAAAINAPILLHIDALPDDGAYSREDRLADFAKRIVFARSANPTCILIDVPFAQHRATTALGDIDAPATEPDELLPAYRTLVHALAGAHAPIGPAGAGGGVRELPVAQGIRAFLCRRDGPQQSSLILWNESADTPTVTMDLPLGDQPREVELSGQSRPAKRTGPGPDALTRLTVGATPVIIENIDPHLLELRSSFALATKVFPAGAGSVQTEVALTNPGPDALRGLLHLEVPKGWTVEPSELHISLLNGASLHEKLTIRYPFTEPEGVKFIRGRLVNENGGELALACPIAVRSKLVALDGFCQLQPNGDLVVQQMITNTAATPLNAQAYALVPGYPRQQRFITDLQPGQTLIKRYVFAASAFTGDDSAPENGPKTGEKQPDAPEIARALKGRNATLGVRQTDGKTLLAKGIPLE